ncbi:ATP-dependent DNA helicase [Kocuria rhizophila]|uniref:ATP-dependent helicase DinG n=1 Tax=Kocuria rhizophila (strain ATCC 9341 / DSM 348 / NBRC 103217 / DC2201) TaxID=378753 RepID=B2GKG5_KOCRD|nr:ATP-dependent DNA helicase [Kocuria rhizophila]BAG29924.1 putative ATP-dependent DNA helicase [Kocuria rhizophila DC2201]VEH74802.1 Probable ATP-dependent helicase dinG homolog [Kocuria rhizophila]
MSAPFVDESGKDVSDVRPESLPGGADALELLDAAVTALGGQRRDGQRFMAAKVAEALQTHRHLLVQAGTGTGKSLAYLIPALVHARSSDKPVVVATATLALQSQITGRDVPRLLDALEDELHERPDVALLKGRSNYACLHKVEGGYPEEEDAALFSVPGGEPCTDRPLGGLAQQVVRLREWVEITDTGDRDDIHPGVSDAAWRQVSVTAKECLGRKCPLVEQCFAERARAQAGEADIVITNHALLAINAFEGLAVLPEHDVVIVDEAHELRDRVTGAVTASLSAAAVRAAGTAVRKHTAASSDALERAAQAFDKAFDDEQSGLLPRGFTEEQVYAVRGIQDAARTGLSETKGETKGEDAGRHAARSRLSELLDTADRVLGADTTHDVLWVSRVGRWSPTEGYVGTDAGEPATLNIAPLSVAGPLREGLFDGRTVVLTSATLAVGSSFSSVAGSLGLQGPGAPSWRGVDVGSPFDYRRQGILYVAKHLPKPSRGVAGEQLDELLALLEASGGGALGLFSSRRAAEDAAEALRERTELPILCQGDASLPSLVKDFTDDPAASLFGTMSLWQGVDVPGQSCRLVVIDRIPFPRPDDPLGTARTRAAERAGGNGFMTVSASHAAVRLAQGAGRLIRASGDRGVVAVLDSRLATARYGSFLARSLPPLWPTTDRSTVLGALQRLNRS